MTDNIWKKGDNDASQISIIDAGDHYDSTDVEGALQEVGSELDTDVMDLSTDQTTLGVKTFTDGTGFVAGRISDGEYDGSANVTVDGWYKIAYVPDGEIAFRARDVDVKCGYIQNIFNFSAGWADSTNANYINYCVMKPSTRISSGLSSVIGARLGYTKSGSAKGAILEVLVDTSVDGILNVKEIANFDTDGNGWIFIDPIISDGLLPDGVTSATYLEAGAEYAIKNTEYMTMSGTILSTDTLIMTIEWPDKAKDSTSMIITDPTSGWIIATAFNQYSLVGFVASSVFVRGKKVSVQWTKAGAFSAGSVGQPAQIRVNGGFGYLNL